MSEVPVWRAFTVRIIKLKQKAADLKKHEQQNDSLNQTQQMKIKTRRIKYLESMRDREHWIKSDELHLSNWRVYIHLVLIQHELWGAETAATLTRRGQFGQQRGTMIESKSAECESFNNTNTHDTLHNMKHSLQEVILSGDCTSGGNTAASRSKPGCARATVCS